MAQTVSRRKFLWQAAGSAAALGLSSRLWAQERAKSQPHTLTVIAGQPRERGKLYGEKFKEGIDTFLNREIYAAFEGKPSLKDQMLRYADACGKEVRKFSPEVYDEMEGTAEGAGIRLAEVVLITLHEELYHKKALPSVDHCTAVAVGPPDTKDGHTYVGQTWDWMPSVFGMSQMTLWKRPAAPSVLAYGFPGMPCGAGLNSAGIAHTWTSAHDKGGKIAGPRVGIPSYVLINHLLHQPTIKDVVAEARRARHAGWFTFVMADGQGNLLNLEGSPEELAVEEHKGALTRVLFGSRQMTGGDEQFVHARGKHTLALLKQAGGELDGGKLRSLFGDQQAGICVGNTIDMMVFDCTARTAMLSRGPAWGATWKAFTFESSEG